MSEENIELIEITPEQAHTWLGFNTHNRSLRQRSVLAYAADMAAGNWRWNGEAIKFAENGTLLDGQHRLAAIAESGATVRMLVVRGLEGRAQETVDGGVKRTFGDVLHLRGEKNHHLLAAIVRRVTLWNLGIRKAGSSPYAPTNAEMLATLEKIPELRDLAPWARQVAANSAVPGSITGLCMWLFANLDSEDASYFFERLRDGQALVKGDPIYELRRTAGNAVTAQSQRSETFLTAVVIKAWNAYRDGASVAVLSYRPGGSKPERFPDPH